MFTIKDMFKRKTVRLCHASADDREWLATRLRRCAKRHGFSWDGNGDSLECKPTNCSTSEYRECETNHYLAMSFDYIKPQARTLSRSLAFDSSWSLAAIVKHVEESLADSEYKNPYRMVIAHELSGQEKSMNRDAPSRLPLS